MFLLLIACVGVLSAASSVLGAQRATAIERIEVALWPEYDRPDAVLVVYRFRLTPGRVLPATVAIPIPAEVGEPHAVAWQDPGGGLMLADFNRVVDGDRALIVVTMRSLEGQLEFYTDLTREGRERSFRFSWPGGVEADGFAFEIQHPVGASSFETVPPGDDRAVGQDGLTYEGVELGPLDSKATPSIELSYEKDSAGLSADTLRPPPPPPRESAPAPVSPAPEESAWLYFAFGGVCFALGLFLLWWTSRTRSRPAAAKTNPKFCLNCGTKLEPRSVFCIECGTRVRP